MVATVLDGVSCYVHLRRVGREVLAFAYRVLRGEREKLQRNAQTISLSLPNPTTVGKREEEEEEEERWLCTDVNSDSTSQKKRFFFPATINHVATKARRKGYRVVHQGRGKSLRAVLKIYYDTCDV